MIHYRKKSQRYSKLFEYALVMWQVSSKTKVQASMFKLFQWQDVNKKVTEFFYGIRGKDCQRMTKSQFEGKQHCNHLGRTLADFP